MTKESLKQVLISILVGACVAFFSSLFSALADLFKAHATQIISGTAAAYHYIAKNNIG